MVVLSFKNNLKIKWGKIVVFMLFNYVYMYISLYLKYIKVLIFCIFFEMINKEIYFNLINK